MWVKIGRNKSYYQLLFRAINKFCSPVSIQTSVGSLLGGNKFSKVFRDGKGEKVRKVLFKHQYRYCVFKIKRLKMKNSNNEAYLKSF